MPLRIVLHPMHGEGGLDAALAAVDDVDLLTLGDDEVVRRALRSDAPVLVAFRWDDRFLVPGLRWCRPSPRGSTSSLSTSWADVRWF